MENGFTVQAYPCGKLRLRQLQIVPGDKVKVELSVYDLSKGRIMERYLSDAEEKARLEATAGSKRRRIKKESAKRK